MCLDLLRGERALEDESRVRLEFVDDLSLLGWAQWSREGCSHQVSDLAATRVILTAVQNRAAQVQCSDEALERHQGDPLRAHSLPIA